MSVATKNLIFHSNSGPQPSLKCKIPLQYQTWVFWDKHKDTLVKILQALKDDNKCHHLQHGKK